MSGRWVAGAACRPVESPPASDAIRVAAAPDAAAEERGWVRRCQQGDEQAFRELMRRYRGRALFLAAQILRDATEAEDVVQEAFLHVFRSIQTFRGDASFYSWLYRIVVNLCLTRSRRKAAHCTVPLEDERDASQPAAGAWETRLAVDAVLAQLSDELRVTLLLREVAGLSYAEIAAELGVPIGTVRSRLSAAREQFRRLWTEMETASEDRTRDV
jgi:RNA polymerase sigma-70 factor (ECF subfamily)